MLIINCLKKYFKKTRYKLTLSHITLQMHDPALRSALWAGAVTFKRPDHRASNTVKSYTIQCG